MPFEFRCPKCKNEVFAQFVKKGEGFRCIHCGSYIVIPEDASEVNDIADWYRDKIEAKSEIKKKQENSLSDSGDTRETIKTANYKGGREGLMENWGVFFLICGVLILIGSIVVSGLITKESSYDSWAEKGIDWSIVVIGIGGLLQSVVTWIVFAGGAEVIRLLKRLNGLEYGGSMSLAECSECGKYPHYEFKKGKVCNRCGSQFEKQ